MSRCALKACFLQGINYNTTQDSVITSLTFVFPSGLLSPKANSYWGDQRDLYKIVLENDKGDMKSLGTIDFHIGCMGKNKNDFYLT